MVQSLYTAAKSSSARIVQTGDHQPVSKTVLCRRGGACKLQNLFDLFQVLLLIPQVVFALFVAYLLLLTGAAFIVQRRKAKKQKADLVRFAFLIPAHNEEVLLPNLLNSIQRCRYPKTHYDVHVIADNCTDHTAQIAEQAGVYVHQRFNDQLIGKGYALKWGLEIIQQAEFSYDAFVIIDADSEISINFLEVMNEHVQLGENAIQAYYAVENPTQSWNISLRYAAFCVLHYLRPLGRMLFGGSAGLKGNGMVFTQDIFARFSWPASITEDIEYHMILLLNGYTVTFAPQAVVWSEMPTQFHQSKSQLNRWEYGRLEMAKKYIPELLRSAGALIQKGNLRRAFTLIDAVLEYLIPPFSLLAGISGILILVDLACLIAAAFFPLLMNSSLLWVNLIIGAFLIIGQVIYLFSGLKMAQAPKIVYQRLLFAPVFILLKVGQMLRMIGGEKPQKWVKTARNQS